MGVYDGARVSHNRSAWVFILFAAAMFAGNGVNAVYDQAYVYVKTPVFRMTSLQQDVSRQQVVVTFDVDGGDRVVPILYMPTVDMGGSDGSLLNVRNNPCAGSQQNKVCCLRSMLGLYDMDVDWMAMDSGMMQKCGNTTDFPASQDNENIIHNGVFSDILANSTVLQGGSRDAIPGASYEYKVVDDIGVLTLRMSMEYLRPRSVTTLVSLGTYKYEFFIGVVFATLRETGPDILSTVIQRNIEFTKSDFGLFAVGTEQESSIVKQIDPFIHQAPRPGDNFLLQYIEMYIDYATSYTGVVLLLEGLRFIKSSSPPAMDSASWVYPCKDADAFGVTQTNDWASLFTSQCLPQNPVFCDGDITNGMFYIPFDTTLSSATDGYIKVSDRDNGLNLYFSFQVEFTLGGSRKVVETIYGTVDLRNFPVLEECATSILDFKSIADTLDISVKLGLDTPDDAAARRRLLQTVDGGTEVSDGNDIRLTTSGSNNIVNQLGTPSASYGDTVISVVVDGLAFSNTYSVKFQIDNLLIFNFLGVDATAYDYLMQQIKSGTGLNIEKQTGDDHFTITPAFDTESPPVSMASCSEMQPTGNYNINCLWRRAIIANEVTADAVQSVYFKGSIPTEVPDTDTEMWVKNTFFPYDTDYLNVNKFISSRCSKAFTSNNDGEFAYNAANEGAYACIFVDPGYRWISKGGNLDLNPLTVSDKTVVIGIVTLRDIDYGDGVATRRLLSINSDGTNMKTFPLSHDGHDETRLYLDNDAPATTAAQVATRRALLSARAGPGTKKGATASVKDEWDAKQAKLAQRSEAAVARADAKRKLKAAFDRRRHHKTGTKLSVLGNTALSRHLLTATSEGEADQKAVLMNETASQVFEISNQVESAYVNIATIKGFTKRWATVTASVEKPTTKSMDEFMRTMNSAVEMHAARMGPGVKYASTVGAVYVPPTPAAARRYPCARGRAPALGPWKWD